MKHVLLVCGAGMSTSLLAKKMEAADREKEYRLTCSDIVTARAALLESDMVLLAPHVGYLREEFVDLCQRINLPCYIVEQQDYTQMDGESVLGKISAVLREHEKTSPFRVELLHNRSGVLSKLMAVDMKKKAVGEERDWLIQPRGISEFTGDSQINIVLVEYQIEYEISGIRRKIQNPLTVAEVVPKELYSFFDGRKVFDYIYEIYPRRFLEKKETLRRKMEQQHGYPG